MPGVAFFHSPRAPFPTFWTPLPMHAPLLTAWAGGPKAARLSGLPKKQLIQHALASVRSALGRMPPVEAALVQDWQADPYSRGGYSYVLVGGQGAREELRKPLEKTLFFAGEATDADEAGTVAGALRSGVRAAREVLAALDPPRFGEVLLPVRRVEPVGAHRLARGGRVHEPAVAEVDADVRLLLAFLVEEQQVAAPQVRAAQRREVRSCSSVLRGRETPACL